MKPNIRSQRWRCSSSAMAYFPNPWAQQSPLPLVFAPAGLALAPIALAEFQWIYLVYALLSLTMIRMDAVAISLIGTGVRLPTLAYLGWFGPRGLATIVFVLLVFGEGVTSEPIRVPAYLLSILLHGITAAPFAARYAHSAAAKADDKE